MFLVCVSQDIESFKQHPTVARLKNNSAINLFEFITWSEKLPILLFIVIIIIIITVIHKLSTIYSIPVSSLELLWATPCLIRSKPRRFYDGAIASNINWAFCKQFYSYCAIQQHSSFLVQMNCFMYEWWHLRMLLLFIKSTTM